MKKLIPSMCLLAVLGSLGCEEQATCFYNCPDDSSQICGQADMEPGQQAKCEQLAVEMCEENPGALVDFGGEVMFKLVTCSGNETCGVPNFCMNDWVPTE